MILVSGCLLGINCKYTGGNNAVKALIVNEKNNIFIPVCPEQLGGLTTPRPPAEIQGNGGEAVIEGKAKVVTREGVDVTKEFIRGGEETLKIAKLYGATMAIFKDGSPSCGCEYIYDGSFNESKVKGMGVTAALLLKEGLKIYSENNYSV